jgi:Flp pilus assembly protein TadD
MNYLGYSWTDQGINLDRAEALIEKAAVLLPSDGYIVDSLGWIKYRRGRFDEAVTHLERAAELRPTDPVINDHLGDAYWHAGRRNEARFQWRRAQLFDPDPELRERLQTKLRDGLTAAGSDDRR